MTTADSWIRHLNLTRHPEGGYYAETYHAAESIDAAALPARFTGTRIFSTAIYFLLESGSPSHFHRLKSDELWHFYTGSAITLHLLVKPSVG